MGVRDPRDSDESDSPSNVPCEFSSEDGSSSDVLSLVSDSAMEAMEAVSSRKSEKNVRAPSSRKSGSPMATSQSPQSPRASGGRRLGGDMENNTANGIDGKEKKAEEANERESDAKLKKLNNRVKMLKNRRRRRTSEVVRKYKQMSPVDSEEESGSHYSSTSGGTVISGNTSNGRKRGISVRRKSFSTASAKGS